MLMGSTDSSLKEHQQLLEYQIELKTRQIEVLQKEIVQMSRSHKEVTEYLNQTLCQECKLSTPAHHRIVMGSGTIYCLSCGFEVLDLLKGRNNQREQKTAQEEYKEFYDSVKQNNKSAL